jgi:hypothetical protein
MDDDRLKALLSQEISSSLTYDKTELAQKRQEPGILRGEMNDTPAMAGRSSVVSMDVADTIGWMLPGIIRVFTASDRMAIYEPEKPGDEEFAKQATDYANYVFMKDNPGYRIMWDATHDSLLLGNGIVKHWWDDKEECEYSEHSGLTEEQIAILQQDNEGSRDRRPEEGRAAVYPGAGPDRADDEQPIETYDVKVKRVHQFGPAEGRVHRAGRLPDGPGGVQIENARFCAHRRM